MILQLLLGSALTITSIVVATLVWWVTEVQLAKLHMWSIRPPHGPRMMTILALALVGALIMLSAAVWIWAIAFHALGIFTTFESSVYFSLVAFTTLGFGDILLPVEWRLLGGFAAANGLLLFGLLTAILVETLRATRLRQRDGQS